jgi:hypothetical protein
LPPGYANHEDGKDRKAIIPLYHDSFLESCCFTEGLTPKSPRQDADFGVGIAAGVRRLRLSLNIYKVIAFLIPVGLDSAHLKMNAIRNAYNPGLWGQPGVSISGRAGVRQNKDNFNGG